MTYGCSVETERTNGRNNELNWRYPIIDSQSYQTVSIKRLSCVSVSDSEDCVNDTIDGVLIIGHVGNHYRAYSLDLKLLNGNALGSRPSFIQLELGS